jgi:hypothetical protein
MSSLPGSVRKSLSQERDRWFESGSLQRRVYCEPIAKSVKPNVLAARLQTLAEPDAVVIAAGTRRLVGDLFEYRHLGAVEVKGIAGPMQAWQVLRPSVVASRFEALRGSALTRLVGRDEEIHLLLRRWARAKSGDGQVVLVSGEPGLGKSRITAALEERLSVEPHLRLRYFCSPYHQDSALYRSSTSSAARRGSRATICQPPSWRSSRLCWPALPRLTRIWHSSPICCHCRLRNCKNRSKPAPDFG